MNDAWKVRADFDQPRHPLGQERRPRLERRRDGERPEPQPASAIAFDPTARGPSYRRDVREYVGALNDNHVTSATGVVASRYVRLYYEGLPIKRRPERTREQRSGGLGWSDHGAGRSRRRDRTFYFRSDRPDHRETLKSPSADESRSELEARSAGAPHSAWTASTGSTTTLRRPARSLDRPGDRHAIHRGQTYNLGVVENADQPLERRYCLHTSFAYRPWAA